MWKWKGERSAGLSFSLLPDSRPLFLMQIILCPVAFGSPSHCVNRPLNSTGNQEKSNSTHYCVFQAVRNHAPSWQCAIWKHHGKGRGCTGEHVLSTWPLRLQRVFVQLRRLFQTLHFSFLFPGIFQHQPILPSCSPQPHVLSPNSATMRLLGNLHGLGFW